MLYVSLLPNALQACPYSQLPCQFDASSWLAGHDLYMRIHALKGSLAITLALYARALACVLCTAAGPAIFGALLLCQRRGEGGRLKQQ